MEMLNNVELRGIVGSVNLSEIGQSEQARFSVMTEYAHKDKQGNLIIETTWHQCVAFREWRNGNQMPFEELKKGARVHLCGRIKMQRYVDANGHEHTAYGIYVNALTVEG